MVNAGQDITAALLNSLPAPLDVLSTGSVTDLSTETTIGTFPNGIPANDPGVNSAYEFVISGTSDTTGTPTIRLRLYIGSVANGNRIYDSGTQNTTGTASAQAWWIRCWAIITLVGASGTFDSGGISTMIDVSTNDITSVFTAHSINTTVANPIILTAQWGTASSSNTCRTTGGTMGRL